MEKTTMDDLLGQRKSLEAEIQDMRGKIIAWSAKVNEAIGAIRMIDFLISKEKKTDAPTVGTAGS